MTVAVKFILSSNVSVHPRRTLCAVVVERIVRIFILAARLFHSQFQIVFSSAESGRFSGQADLHIFYPNVGVHLRRTLCAVRVERIVRNFILAVLLFHFPFKSKSPSPLHLCSAWSRSVHFQCERQRSPDGAPCAPYGATPCWSLFFFLFSRQ